MNTIIFGLREGIIVFGGREGDLYITAHVQSTIQQSAVFYLHQRQALTTVDDYCRHYDTLSNTTGVLSYLILGRSTNLIEQQYRK